MNSDIYKSINLNDKEIYCTTDNDKEYPIFIINGEKYLYKPLSKTKPYVCDISLFGEVYWSNILNRYFDSSVPISKLAYFDNNKLPKKGEYKFNHGILVKYFIKDNEKLINLVDCFNKYPDPNVDISNYMNYALIDYNYVPFFNSSLIKNNYNLGASLAYQVLLSLLRCDRNFHYGNVGFIVNEQQLKFHPPIDFEFSSMFLFCSNSSRKWLNNIIYRNMLPINEKYRKAMIEATKMGLNLPLSPENQTNLFYIIKNYPDVLNTFLNKFKIYQENIDKNIVIDNEEFIQYFFNFSHNFYIDIGTSVHDKNMIELKENISKFNKTINKKDLLININNDLKKYALRLEVFIKLYLLLYKMGYDKLEELTIENVSDILNYDINYNNYESDEYYVKLLKKISK